jgi:ATP-dependent DNA helicase PIF1
MRVILQSNISPVHGLVNGAQGTIIGFEAFDPTKVPRKATDKRGDNGVLRGPHADYAHEQIWAFGRENQRQPWPIVEFDNGVRDVIYAECSYSELGNEEERKGENQPRGAPSLLSRTQIPLIAGYAITVHKSQVRLYSSPTVGSVTKLMA